MKEYEDGLRIAETYDVRNAINSISKQLMSLYKRIANSLEKSDSLEEALSYHEKCLSMCQMAEDRLAEGQACFRIGLVHYNQCDYKKSLTYQKRYHKLSTDEHNKEGITNSLAAIATTYQAMENISLAIETLEDLHQ
jgi:tetratricopeptide (TPR) repeat protein